MAEKRYVVCTGWGHIFSEQDEHGRPIERERDTRWVYDRTVERLGYLDVMYMGSFIEGNREEYEDVLDSLHHGNEEVIDDPDNDDHLFEADDLPEWARTNA